MPRNAGSWGTVAVAFVLTGTAGSAAAQQRIELESRDRRLAPELEEVYAVGALDGADWETFGEVSQVGFDEAGNLYVLDTHNHRVVVVDRSGGFVRQFGKEGEGPGEWRMPGGMGVLADGTVVISDAGHRAYLVYGPDGEFRHAVPMPGGGMITLGTLQADPRGGAVFNAAGAGFMMRVARGDGPVEAAPAARPIQRVTLDADGGVTDFYTAWMAPRDEAPRSLAVGGGTQLRMGGGPRIFEPGLHVGVLPDGGLAVVDSSAYLVRLVGPDGRLRGLITRDIEPVEVTPRIQERELERRLAQIESGEGPQMRVMVRGDDGGTRTLGQDQIREMQKEQLRNQGFHPEIPVVERLRVTPRGTIWLERATVGPDDDGPIDVFTSAGRYLGTVAADGVRIPTAFGPDGLAAYVDRDELDVPTIRVVRLPEEVR